MNTFHLTTAAVIFVCVVAGSPAMAETTSLDQLVDPGEKPVVLGTGYGFCEGPAADAEGHVYFSDGKNDAIHVYRLDEGVRLFVGDALDANGMMFNQAGELVVCEGAAYRVVAFDVKTKQFRVLVGDSEDRRFNEPNDLAIDRAGGFYFTDPNYAHRGQKQLKKQDVYYVSPDGEVSTVSTICEQPNGVLLSADGKTLYVADCRGKAIYRYDVAAPGNLTGQTKWIPDLGAHPDGMTADIHGNLYFACGSAGIHVYAPTGKLIGTLDVGYASNCCFGGPDFRTLYITSAERFLGLKMKVEGTRPLCAK